MPTPTILVPFGDSTASSNVFAKVELDSDTNKDENGNIIEEFYDTELVNILVHIEPGAFINNISTSFGSIINASSPDLVHRTNTIEGVTFKGVDHTYTLPHYPSSNIDKEWIGRTRNLVLSDRTLTCTEDAGICNLSYSFEAYLFILQVNDLDLSGEQEFPVEVSFNVEK